MQWGNLKSQLVVVLSIVFSTVIGASGAYAANAPSASWTSPQSGATVTGVFSLHAVGSPDPGGTATIAKWCFTRNGSALTGQSVGWDPDPTATTSWRSLTTGSDGCISSTGGTLASVWIVSDSTKWDNGTYTYTAQVTDSSGRVSPVASTSIEVANLLPQLGQPSFSQSFADATLTGTWQSTDDGVITVDSCEWTVDGQASPGASCAEGKSELTLPVLKPGEHSVVFSVKFTNSHVETRTLRFKSTAFKMTVAHTSLSLSCPSSLKGSGITCKVRLASDNGISGSISVTPKYMLKNKWIPLKAIKVSVGQSASFVLPNKIGDTESVNVFASLVDGQIKAQQLDYTVSKPVAAPAPVTTPRKPTSTPTNQGSGGFPQPAQPRGHYEQRCTKVWVSNHDPNQSGFTSIGSWVDNCQMVWVNF
jgi:hypothetical protein